MQNSQSNSSATANKQELFNQLQTEVDAKTGGDTLTSNESSLKDNISVTDIQNPPARFEVPPRQASDDLSNLPSIESFFQQSDAEKQQDGIASEILNLSGFIDTKDNFQAEAEERFGVNANSTLLADLEGRMGVARTKFGLISDDVSIESDGRQRSSAAGSNIIDAREKRAMREYLVLGAQTQAVQGQLTNARALVQRAVDIEYRDEEQKLERLETFYRLNGDKIDRDNTKKQQALQIKLDERKRILAEEKEEEVKKETYAMNVLANGGTEEMANQIRGLESSQDAFSVAGDLLISPDVMLAKKSFNENVKNNAFAQEMSKLNFNESKRQFNANYGLQKDQIATAKRANQLAAEAANAVKQGNYVKAMQTAELQNADTQDTVNKIDSLVNSEFFDHAFGRYTEKIGLSFTDKANASGVNQNSPLTIAQSREVADMKAVMQGLTSERVLENMGKLKGSPSDKDADIVFNSIGVLTNDKSSAVAKMDALNDYRQAQTRIQAQRVIDATPPEYAFAVAEAMKE